MDKDHFDKAKRREAVFISPPNLLKAKVGAGGVHSKTLERAEHVLQSSQEIFIPQAHIYLDQMADGIRKAKEKYKSPAEAEPLISGILAPAAQLKANGGMFNFPLITRLADKLVHFLEVVDGIDPDMLDIAAAYHSTLKRVIANKVSGEITKFGEDLVEELNGACARYFDRRKS